MTLFVISIVLFEGNKQQVDLLDYCTVINSFVIMLFFVLLVIRFSCLSLYVTVFSIVFLLFLPVSSGGMKGGTNEDIFCTTGWFLFCDSVSCHAMLFDYLRLKILLIHISFHSLFIYLFDYFNHIGNIARHELLLVETSHVTSLIKTLLFSESFCK